MNSTGGYLFDLSMFSVYAISVSGMLILAVIGWLIGLYQNKVNAVDVIWSLFFLAAATITLTLSTESSVMNMVIFGLLALWSLRLAGFLIWRNWNKPEDRRYQVIRANNSPGFAFKSLYIVYLLQAFIAAIIFFGVFPGLSQWLDFQILDLFGISIALIGILIESIADQQLARFKKQQTQPSQVMDQGLWAYSRHPNYFGEFLFWWGLFLIIVESSWLWAIVSPLIMTILLLKVSGVGLMEKGIEDRRPAYAAYIKNTPAFFPRLTNPLVQKEAQ